MLTETPRTTQQQQRRQGLRFVDGVPRCNRNKEAEKVKQMKENDSSSVSRKESACNSRTAEERMESSSSSSTGGNLTSTKNRKQRCHVHCIAKEHEIHELNQQSVKYRTANGMQNRCQRHGDQVTQKYGRQAKVTSSSALENRRTNTRCNHSEQNVAKEINWTMCISERVNATFITINRQRITQMSVYMPHSGYRVASLCFSRCGPLTSINRVVDHGIFLSTTKSWSELEISATRQATQQTDWGDFAVSVHECGPQSSWKHLNLVPCELRLGCWTCEHATTDQLMSFFFFYTMSLTGSSDSRETDGWM